MLSGHGRVRMQSRRVMGGFESIRFKGGLNTTRDKLSSPVLCMQRLWISVQHLISLPG